MDKKGGCQGDERNAVTGEESETESVTEEYHERGNLGYPFG